MGTSSESFVCAECGAGMERVESAPVLQSLAGHTVHRCGNCGHILLVPKKAGDPCQTDDDCRPTEAQSSRTMVTNTYLACDTAAKACVATAGPTVADWMKPCSPDVVAQIAPAGSTRAFDRGAPDPGCAEGWCAAARVEGAACVANSCTRACTSDDQCPDGSTCILFVNGTDTCDTPPMGWCKPGGPAGIGFTCM